MQDSTIDMLIDRATERGNAELALTVDCPYCPAKAGEPCNPGATYRGKPTKTWSPHMGRVLVAREKRDSAENTPVARLRHLREQALRDADDLIDGTAASLVSAAPFTRAAEYLRHEIEKLERRDAQRRNR